MIRVHHEKQHGITLDPKGWWYTGRTLAVIWDGNMRYIGISYCSKRDNFCKKTGYKQALSRVKIAQSMAKASGKRHEYISKFNGNDEGFVKIAVFDVRHIDYYTFLNLPEWMYKVGIEGE